MTSRPSIFRQAYDAVALVAVLNVLGLFALGLLLVWSGAVNSDKLHRVVGVLRGEEPPAATEPAVTVDEKTPDAAAAVPSPTDLEIMRLEGDRIKQELDQRLALNNSILLRVTTEREKFAAKRKEEAAKREEALRRREAEGFKKQISIYEALSPRIALQHLLDLPEPDDAARLLLAMNTRKAKKIVEAAKSGNALAKMKTILQRVREVAPDRSTELAANEP